MRSAGLYVALAAVGLLLAAAPAGVAAPPPVGECRTQAAGERPSATADDIVNCVVDQADARRVRATVSYTYASPLGRQNIWMGVDVIGGGNRLKWFGYRPASITASSGTVTIEILYGQNSPPAGKLSTDQLEFFMYVGGGQIFYRKTFTYKHDWQL
jgi:hypothetical protein